MNAKKLLAALTALTMAVSLAACGGNDESQGEADGTTTAFTAGTENDSEETTTAADEEETEAETTTEETTTTEAETEPPLEVVEPAAEEFTYNYDAALKGAVITAYNGEAEAIRIPSELGGDTVVLVSLERNDHVKKVELPDSITTIGKNAFNNCRNLISINIPDGVTAIGERAFYYCDNLVSVVIPDSVTKIGDEAFSYCENLKKIEVPSGVENLMKTFVNCESLEEVILHEGLKSIGEEYFVDEDGDGNDDRYGIDYWYIGLGGYTFQGCSSLESITIPESVEVVCRGAFEDSGLKSIVIPKNVKEIRPEAFSGCTNLTDIDFQNNMKVMPSDMLGDCTSLENMKIPDGIEAIEGGVFHNCTSLKDVYIPDSVKFIGSGAFYDCTSLRELELPDGLAYEYFAARGYVTDTFNAASAFYGCDGLTVTYKGKEYNYSNWDELTQAVKDSGIEYTVE